MTVTCSNLKLGKDSETLASMPAACITEFIGTFFLVFTVYLTVAQGAFLAPLAIGTSLGVMVYMGGHVSGAHYNPAVTLALGLSCRHSHDARFAHFTWINLGLYVGSQCVGGILAALIGYALTGSALVWSPEAGTRGVGPAFVAEVLYTFALASVVLNVATSKTNHCPGGGGQRQDGPTAFFGFCIGMTVFVGAVSIGQISGCVLNPAVGTGIILTHAFFGGGMKAMSNIALYWAGPCVGGALAAAVYFLTNPKEYAKSDEGDSKA
jgi:aquaporin Z